MVSNGKAAVLVTWTTVISIVAVRSLCVRFIPLHNNYADVLVSLMQTTDRLLPTGCFDEVIYKSNKYGVIEM